MVIPSLYPRSEVHRMQEPDDITMGQWVDGWLQSLRRQGSGERQLLAAARTLGTASANGRLALDNPSRTVKEFLRWVDEHHPR